MLYKCKPARVEIYNNTARKTAAQVKAATGCDIVFNGGLYDMGTFKPCCDVRIGGVTLSNDPYTYWGYGWKRGELPRVVHSQDMASVDDYLSCLWAIINGTKEPLDNNHSAMGGVRGRTAFGFTAGGEMVILCVADGSGALSLTGTRDALYNAGCVSGIILDGGGSSQIISPAGTITSSRIVSNFVCVWLEDKGDKPVATKKYKICLDPGHGLKELNQSPDGTYFEHEFALDISKRERTHLLRCGFDVMLTREDSSTPALSARAAAANAWGADLYVSNHTNAADNSGWRDDVSGFLIMLYAAGGERERMAKLLIEEMRTAGVKIFGTGIFYNKNLTVLAKTNMPAVLPEYMFHTNRADVALLKNSVYREMLAIATVKAICRYFGVAWVGSGTTEPTTPPVEPPKVTLPPLTRLLCYKGSMMYGSDIKALQTALNAKGYNSGTADGWFGANTDRAVRAYQAASKLAVDGIVGPATWTKLGG